VTLGGDHLFQYQDDPQVFRHRRRKSQSAAPPGKGGYHHVNCQDAAYWQRAFEAHGFKLDREITADLRRTSTMPREFVRETGMFFVQN
jgi:hypothetical protein